MRMENGQFILYGNALKKSDSKKALRWENRLIRKFNYDPEEEYKLSLVDNEYLGPIFGLKDIVRHDQPSRTSASWTVGRGQQRFSPYAS